MKFYKCFTERQLIHVSRTFCALHTLKKQFINMQYHGFDFSGNNQKFILHVYKAKKNDLLFLMHFFFKTNARGGRHFFCVRFF